MEYFLGSSRDEFTPQALYTLYFIILGIFQTFFALYYYQLSGGSYLGVAILIAIPYFVSMFAIPYWGTLIDRVGSKKVMIGSSIVSVIAFTSYTLLSDPIALFVAYTFFQSILSSFIPAVQRYASLVTIKLGDMFGRLSATASFGFMIGSFSSGFIFDNLGVIPLFIIAVVVSLVLVAFSVFGVREVIPEPKKETASSTGSSQTVSIFDCLKNRDLVIISVIGCLFNFGANSIGILFSIYFVEEIGANLSLLGISYGLATLSGMLLSLYLGAKADIFGRKLLVLGSAFGGVLLWPVFLFVTDPILLVILYAVPLYVGLLVAGPIIVSETSSEKARGRSMAIYGSAGYLGTSTGALFGGIVATTFGSVLPNAIVATIFMVVCTIVTVFFLRETKELRTSTTAEASL